MAVFTKYDVLVESLKPREEEDFYGDIEDLEMGLNEIDPGVLSRAEKELHEMIAPFDFEMLGVPWVKVSGLHILPFVLVGLINF